MASFTVFPYPQSTNCENYDINCSDPNSVLIHVILSIAKSTQGVQLSQIQENVQLLCPHLNWTNATLNLNISNALRRGVLTTIYNPESESPSYAINAGMWRMNPANKKYFCINQLYSSSVK